MKPHFKPAAGKMVVKRDRVSEKIGGLYKTEDTLAYESYWNPWGVVIAIGDRITLENGSTLESEYFEGDRVAFARMGHDLKLTAPDGEEIEVYVLAWDGAYGFLYMECEFCGAQVRSSDDLPDPSCPSCGRQSGSPLVAPSLGESLQILGTKP